MPPAKPGSDSSSSTLYVLIVFVVLFLAAAVFSVVMFLNNEELKTRANRAEDELAQFGNQSQIQEVKTLVGPNKTVLGQLGADMKILCGIIGGEEFKGFSLAEANANVVTQLNRVWWQEVGRSLQDPCQASPGLGLKTLVETLVREKQSLREAFVGANKLQETQRAQWEQERKQLQDQIAQITKDLDEASSAAKKAEQQYTQRITDLTNRYEGLFNQVTEEKKQLTADNDDLNKQIKSLQGEIEKYKENLKNMEVILKQIRPSPEMELAALVPDGTIVSVNTRDKVAYINLTKNDHIYRGLTFSVYDSYGRIPKTGKGKGTIEVIETMDNISKCRITQLDPSNPIMENDIIANLVWDKDKKYKFCVAGDFDFNDDGIIDSDGRAKIADLISGWGGQVVDKLSVDTDFLVIGQTPVVPPRPKEEEFDRNTAAVKAYQTAKKRLDEYQEILESGKSLGVPTFNQSRFFLFIGYQPEEGTKAQGQS